MEQSTPPIPHTLAEFAWIALAVVLTYLSKHLPSLFRRKPSKAEEKKIEAEARHIDIQGAVEASTMMVDLMRVSAQATLDVERLRREKEFWQAKAESEIEAREAAETAREIVERQLDRKLIRLGKNDA